MTASGRGAASRRSALVIPSDAAVPQPGRPLHRSQPIPSLIGAGSVAGLDRQPDDRRRYDLLMIVEGSAEAEAP